MTVAGKAAGGASTAKGKKAIPPVRIHLDAIKC